jgi:hypothetical protein
MRVGPGSRLPLGETLQAALGPATVVRRQSSSPRSRVWLVEFGGAPAIVKQITGGSDAGERYARERTALRLARRVRPYVVPDVLGADPDARVLVLEYLTASTRRPAGAWMTDFATALARLHTATGPSDTGALPAWTAPGEADARSFTDLARGLDVPVPAGLARCLADLARRLDPAAGHALLHGDPCPDNAMPTSDGIRFVDLEQAALGRGLTELAYLRMGFPTCWCATSVPAPVLDEAEAAYRSTWRSITGTDPPGDLADACAGWLIRGDTLVERAHRGQSDQLARVTRQDWRWGTATARQRLAHRLAVVAAFGADHPELASVAEVSSDLRDRLLARWADIRPLPAAEGNPLGHG